ncbi:IS1 family transposase [Shigella flexneri]|uniref:IS1 family transposase n=1 Tax=Shigella flexneri TaxID=623 RepID=UPI0010082AD8|nr:IS1 family transposase [Shigella flexneri]
MILQFDFDRDINGAARDVQAAINAAQSLLPSGMPSRPTYRKANPSDAPIMILTLTSDTYSQGELYDFASTQLAPTISQIDGVGDVDVGGSSLPAVRVGLTPQALFNQGVSLDDVRTAISNANVRKPQGALEDGLLSLLSAFEVVVWMTDGWPLYESRLKGKLHVISKRYTQRIERHNLNLRQHLARLGRKSLSFSKSVELHDKVIGHYLNIKHYQ